MINEVYRLYAPKQFRIDLIEEYPQAGSIIVRPEYLSICAADKRYYLGDRDQTVLHQKLPMALIHEAVGTVLADSSGQYGQGQKVVLLPNVAVESDEIISENYLRSSHFRSSGYDGFMQSFVVAAASGMLPYKKADPQVMVMAEMMSVGQQALGHFDRVSHRRRRRLGIWGSGNVGFIMALTLRQQYPDSEICLFSVNPAQMEYFSFVDNKYQVDRIPADLMVDHAFECVGGAAASTVINQIIDHIQPMGTISLLGVSNDLVGINTRMVLEKGLTLAGSSRSTRQDFIKAIDLIDSSQAVQQYLATITNAVIDINSINDIYQAFDSSLTHQFKTVMKWNI